MAWYVENFGVEPFLRSFLDVVDRSYRARVYIVSPTTLMATLNTVRAVLKDVRMREQALVMVASNPSLRLQERGALLVLVDHVQVEWSRGPELQIQLIARRDGAQPRAEGSLAS